jgi:Flp pilus assembly pilin Flp
MSVSRFLRETVGAAMVEFTLILPLLLLVALGTVDVTLMLYDWALANKAAYRGARVAVVAAPVASEITELDYDTNPLHIGDLCFAIDSGAADGAVACPTVTTSCNSTSCSSPWEEHDNNAFSVILGEMQDIFPRLTADNLIVEYQTTGLGFYGRPDGLPMNVTVRIVCMRAQFFFMGALMNWAADLPEECEPDGGPGGFLLPSFATTLQSEGMGAS